MSKCFCGHLLGEHGKYTGKNFTRNTVILIDKTHPNNNIDIFLLINKIEMLWGTQ